MPITTLTHQSKKVVFIDYQGCSNKDDMLDMVRQTTDYVLAMPDPHVLMLFDYTHAFGSRDYMKLAQESRDKIYKAKSTKSACIGISGIKKVLLQGYNAIGGSRGLKPFNTKEEALDYLVSDD